MMGADADQVLEPRLLVKGDELVRIPGIGVPGPDHILKAMLGGVAEAGQVVLVGRGSLCVHVRAVVVIGNALGLSAPVGPDPQLGIAKPLRTTIGLERFPGRLERPRGDRPGRCLRPGSGAEQGADEKSREFSNEPQEGLMIILVHGCPFTSVKSCRSSLALAAPFRKAKWSVIARFQQKCVRIHMIQKMTQIASSFGG